MTLTDRVLGLARSVHRSGHGTAADLGLYAASAAFAGITAVTSTLPAHRAWGGVAVIGYLALCLVALGQLLATRVGALRSLTGAGVRMVVVFAGWSATTLVPLVIEAAQRAGGATGRAQQEVSVVEMAGARLVDTGSPYLSHDQIVQSLPTLGYLAYVPYNPGIAVFGLPRRYFGDLWWTDARVGFAVVTAAALIGALALLRRRAPGTVLVRAAQAVTVLPVCALTLATGGDDLPVLALALLALAFAARALSDPVTGSATDAGRSGQGWWLVAGLVIGDAAAMKLFAWPVLVVLAVFAVARGCDGTVSIAAKRGAERSRSRRHVAAGWRVAGWFLAPALAVPVLTLVPVTLRDPGGVVENLVRYPLGRGLAKSPAASNLPGHLIAVLVPHGGTVAAALLVVAGLAFAVHLVARPPVDAGAAARRAAVAMLLAILLAPATRFGYLLYPAAYAVWSVALAGQGLGSPRGDGSGTRGPGTGGRPVRRRTAERVGPQVARSPEPA